MALVSDWVVGDSTGVASFEGAADEEVFEAGFRVGSFLFFFFLFFFWGLSDQDSSSELLVVVLTFSTFSPGLSALFGTDIFSGEAVIILVAPEITGLNC